MKKLRSGVWWDYDDKSGLYYNHFTNRWIKDPRKPLRGKLKGKSIGKSISPSPKEDFHYFDFNIKISDNIEDNERIQLFLTKVIQKYRVHLYRKDGNILFDMDNNSYEEDTYSYFTYNDIRNLLGSNYKRRLDWLLSNNYIRREYKTSLYGNYLYTFIPLNKLLLCEAEIIPVKTLRVWNSLIVYYKKKEKALGELSYLFDIVSKFNFKITQQQFNEVLKNNYSEYKKEKEYKREKYFELEDYIEHNQYIYKNILHYNKLSRYERLDYFSKDKFSGRFHSIFTSIPKKIRELYIEGITNSIDLKQSQPTFLAKLVKDSKGDNDYTRDVENNDIYLKLLDKSNISNRNISKVHLFSIIFGKVYITNSKGYTFMNKKHSEFCRLYPKAGEYITELKTSKNTLKKQHSILALKLQQLELSVFKIMWERLKELKIKFIPVHDEILFNKKDFDIVNKIFNETLKDELNIKFKLNYYEQV